MSRSMNLSRTYCHEVPSSRSYIPSVTVGDSGKMVPNEKMTKNRKLRGLTIPPVNRRHHFSLNLPFFLHLDSSYIIHKCISNKNYGAWRHNMGYIGKSQNKSGRLKFFRSTYRITSWDYYSFFRFKKYLLWNKLDAKIGLLFCFFPFPFWPPKLNSIFEPRHFPIHRSDP